MIWAACYMAFFGFLRSSELTVPSQDGYDPSVHLSLSDVAVDSRSSPSMIQVRIKQSKTDPFRLGVNLYLGKTDAPVCPVKGILTYLAIRDGTPGPFFKLGDCRYLTRSIFSFLDTLLVDLHLDKEQFNTHTFILGLQLQQKLPIYLICTFR